MTRTLAMLVVLLLAGVGVPTSLLGQSGAREPAVSVDLRLTGDLTGEGRPLEVEWYTTGPVRVMANNPPLFVRGVRVKDRVGHALAQWESEETTLSDFFPELSGLWKLSGTRGLAIATAVQYGGAVVELYLFRFEQGNLRRIWTVGGRAIAAREMGNPRQRVVVVQPALGALPQLYIWKGRAFGQADAEFPEFWAHEAPSYSEPIYSAQAVPPGFLALWCQRGLRAYALGAEAAVGRKSCLAARDRISSGRALVPSYRGESQADFRLEKRKALAEIESALKESSTNP